MDVLGEAPMSDVTQIPMHWEDAYRLVANELGVPHYVFASWVQYAHQLGQDRGEKWLAAHMEKAARKKQMREQSPKL